MVRGTDPASSSARNGRHGVRAADAFVVAAAAAAVAAAGCAGTQVSRLATEGAPAYELQGSSLSALGREAEALCPKGYAALRVWERFHTAGAPGGAEAVDSPTWWGSVSGWVVNGRTNAAQMTVQCRA